MFEGFFAKRPWLVDILTPESVAENVIHGIQTNADRLFLPGSLNISMVKSFKMSEYFNSFKVLNQILPRNAGLTFLSWGGVLDAMNDVSRFFYKSLRIKDQFVGGFIFAYNC